MDEKTVFYFDVIEDADGKEVTSTTDDNHNNTFVTSATEKNYILKLANDSSYDLGVTTSSIKIPALSFYRISVWAFILHFT